MADKLDNKAFGMMTAVADNTNVDIYSMKAPREHDSKDLHNVLMAAGFTPGIGNIADAADALLYAFEGEYGEAAISSLAMIPLAGQLVSARKASKVGEEMVTLYRGVDKWFPGKMVEKGSFIGGAAHKTGKISGKAQGSLDFIKTSHSEAIGETIKDKAIWLTDLKDIAKYYANIAPEGFEQAYKSKGIKPGFLLEFEVPKSLISKKAISLSQEMTTYEGSKKMVEEGLQYIFQEGIPKEFLTKVHKVK